MMVCKGGERACKIVFVASLCRVNFEQMSQQGLDSGLGFQAIFWLEPLHCRSFSTLSSYFLPARQKTRNLLFVPLPRMRRWARALEVLTKSQFAPQGSSFQKSNASNATLPKRATPFSCLAWWPGKLAEFRVMASSYIVNRAAMY